MWTDANLKLSTGFVTQVWNNQLLNTVKKKPVEHFASNMLLTKWCIYAKNLKENIKSFSKF